VPIVNFHPNRGKYKEVEKKPYKELTPTWDFITQT
jgi:hypothetical protein